MNKISGYSALKQIPSLLMWLSFSLDLYPSYFFLLSTAAQDGPINIIKNIYLVYKCDYLDTEYVSK